MARDIIITDKPVEKKVSTKTKNRKRMIYPFANTFQRDYAPKVKQTPSKAIIDVENYTHVYPTDVLLEGDEYYHKGHWFSTGCWVFKQKAGTHLTYRRPLKYA